MSTVAYVLLLLEFYFPKMWLRPYFYNSLISKSIKLFRNCSKKYIAFQNSTYFCAAKYSMYILHFDVHTYSQYSHSMLTWSYK